MTKNVPDNSSSSRTKRLQSLSTAPGTLNLLLGSIVLVMLALLLVPDSESQPPTLIVTDMTTIADEPVAPAVSSTDNSTEPPTPVVSPEEPAATLPPTAKLVLILDDLGYSAEAGLRAINLPSQITFAVIPHTPYGKALAEAAHQAGRELMLHAPMSNLSGMDLGEGGLTLQQSEEEFMQVLTAALADIPYIKGVNNHTGSELTAAVQPMQWVMQELKKRDLYFVDSMTTPDSVAGATAEQFRVPSLRRHVFLDHIQTTEAIDIEFKRAIALAQQRGYAVAIGHPYPETLAYLETVLPMLVALQVDIVPVSVMLEQLQIVERSSENAAPTDAW